MRMQIAHLDESNKIEGRCEDKAGRILVELRISVLELESLLASVRNSDLSLS